ncbi:unnamed protein product [Brugia timori]|uniref:Secreted protein n=1 Tax=Brugia timori TaxID=42155 RepID=A0A0R3Q500_9BILA|nr:unnamed protein product [Brugia timori]
MACTELPGAIVLMDDRRAKAVLVLLRLSSHCADRLPLGRFDPACTGPCIHNRPISKVLVGSVCMYVCVCMCVCVCM